MERDAARAGSERLEREAIERVRRADMAAAELEAARGAGRAAAGHVEAGRKGGLVGYDLTCPRRFQLNLEHTSGGGQIVVE